MLIPFPYSSRKFYRPNIRKSDPSLLYGRMPAPPTGPRGRGRRQLFFLQVLNILTCLQCSTSLTTHLSHRYLYLPSHRFTSYCVSRTRRIGEKYVSYDRTIPSLNHTPQTNVGDFKLAQRYYKCKISYLG